MEEPIKRIDHVNALKIIFGRIFGLMKDGFIIVCALALAVAVGAFIVTYTLISISIAAILFLLAWYCHEVNAAQERRIHDEQVRQWREEFSKPAHTKDTK